MTFALLCLLGGCVVLVHISFRVRASDDKPIGRAILAFILASIGCFLFSLGGATIATTARLSSLAATLEWSAIVAACALQLGVLFTVLYGIARFLRRPGSHAKPNQTETLHR